MTAGGGDDETTVAAIVLSWNGREDTLACLRSLGGTVGPRVLPIVVDNGSRDGTSEAVREHYPEAIVLRSERNLGFAEGNNVGLRTASTMHVQYVLLLNNDAVVAPDTVATLVDEARHRPDAGVLCPIIYYVDPSDLIWYAGRSFDPRRGYHGAPHGWQQRDRGQFDGVRRVDTATGCAMLVPSEAIAEVGLLDPELFLHGEDIEWCLRFREHGWQIYVVSKAKVWHRISASSGGEHSDTVAYYSVRNVLEVCARHAPVGRARSALREAELMAAHLVHLRRARRPWVNLKAVLEGYWDYRRRHLGPRGQTFPKRS